ncbi:hypothetical protein LINPERPRIM_LOCUS21223 [Linum perenne]
MYLLRLSCRDRPLSFTAGEKIYLSILERRTYPVRNLWEGRFSSFKQRFAYRQLGTCNSIFLSRKGPLLAPLERHKCNLQGVLGMFKRHGDCPHEPQSVLAPEQNNLIFTSQLLHQFLGLDWVDGHMLKPAEQSMGSSGLRWS